MVTEVYTILSVIILLYRRYYAKRFFMLNCLLISNMYPTADYPGYGSFVRNVCVGLEPYGIHTKYKAVIRGKARSVFGKIFKYLWFYGNIIAFYFQSYDFLYVHFPNQAIPILNILLHLRRRRVVVNFHGKDLLYAPHGTSGKLGTMMNGFAENMSMLLLSHQPISEIL